MIMNTRPVILFITETFDIGGITTFVETCSRFLTERGYHTTVIGKAGSSSLRMATRTHRIIHALPATQHSRFLSLRDMVAFAKAAQKTHRAHTVTAIHFNDPMSALAILALCPWVWRIPRIYTFHGDKAGELASEGIRHPLRSVRIWTTGHIQTFVLRACTSIAAVSNHTKRYLITTLGLPSSKITVIHNGVRIPSHTVYHPTNEHIVRLLSLSRFEPRKGHILLLRSLRILLDQGVHLTATLCGPLEGNLQPILQEYQRLNLFDAVQILHRATYEQQQRLWKKTDIFVIPSLGLEHCPYGLLEALGSGLLSVGTSTSGIYEILAPIDPKLMATHATPEHLATAILRVIRMNHPKKRALALRAKTHIGKTYAYTNYARYERLYRL